MAEQAGGHLVPVPGNAHPDVHPLWAAQVCPHGSQVVVCSQSRGKLGFDFQ